MAILITGAAGFVALNVIEHPLTAGRDVVGLDRIALPARAHPRFRRAPRPIHPQRRLHPFKRRHKPRAHYRAEPAVMTAARHGKRHLSGWIYGSAARDVRLIDEDALSPAPVALYGLTKRAAETMLRRIAATQNVRFAAARLGSVYGPSEYDTGVRDTLSPMLQVLQCALATRKQCSALPGAATSSTRAMWRTA